MRAQLEAAQASSHSELGAKEKQELMHEIQSLRLELENVTADAADDLADALAKAEEAVADEHVALAEAEEAKEQFIDAAKKNSTLIAQVEEARAEARAQSAVILPCCRDDLKTRIISLLGSRIGSREHVAACKSAGRHD